MGLDRIYMQRALTLAKRAQGKVNPNPMVGAVIVKNEEIVGEGYHEYYGGPHAEINALVMAGEKAKGADIYVTLEPCSHYGKTPPCAKALVAAGVKRVVIAMVDPNPMVAGKGIQILKENGIEVVTGVLEKEAKKLNEIFIKYITKKLPFVVMKTASTLDGKIATVTGESRWISGEKSREYVHQLRNNLMGIMVGIGTILADDPLLTTRLKDEEGKSPAAIIADSNLRIPLNSKILDTVRDRKIIIGTTESADKNKIEQLQGLGVEIIVTPDLEGKVDLKYLMKEAGSLGIDSILLEGGSTLNFSALKQGIVDKVMCFIAPKLLGGKTAKTSVEGEGINSLSDVINITDMTSTQIGEDILVQGYIEMEEE
ncbi:MAG: bifunctional diaminohydroxyphosphoribosylaminopyrimidine deaminase/5-amino-6-(5-phosphoribosylamino)uracil reductase RibD [Bacillota bacterium]|nr:bifunctional diaminohydroxyphosphoribosylaminopyrimidine deaminase/5-amino-6-(5-phosphoribosylamino)uracil reductase RibD [Bacillota bacterium]